MPLISRLAVAPMMDWTDRHCRFFMRLLAPNALLYTEMVTTGAVLHGDRARLLGFSDAEHPIALQLGGSDPDAMARSAAIGAAEGYDEINMNVGCPSDRVQSGRFGACLMAEPATVAACVAAMKAAVDLPVTVKCRIGIDEQEGYAPLHDFVTRMVDAGCDALTVHARKAWLKGLSPKENREIPPLQYDIVHRLKADFPDLPIAINGGLVTVAAVEAQLAHVDGVMLGRAAYHDPMTLAACDAALFGGAVPARRDIAARMVPYIQAMRGEGVPLGAITRHMLGLYQGVPGGRAYRRHLAENAHRPGAGAAVLIDAAERAESLMERRLAA